MKITYTGPHSAVVVYDEAGREFTCERGATIEVPQELGQSLLGQEGNWKTSGGRTKAKDEPEEATTDKDGE